MIQHTVSFALTHSTGSPAEQEFLEAAQGLLAAIPGVHDFTVSRQISSKSDHTFQFSMLFDDQAAYDAYNDHPDHRGFVSTRWATEVTSFQELDLIPLT